MYNTNSYHLVIQYIILPAAKFSYFIFTFFVMLNIIFIPLLYYKYGTSIISLWSFALNNILM